MSSLGISLIEMPKVPMEHILKYLDFPSILILRKVCHDFRNFIDDTKPESCLTKLCINVKPGSIQFDLHLPRPSFSVGVCYVKNREGCSVKCYKDGKVKKTMTENDDMVTVFSKDFDIIFRHQKTVSEEFRIRFDSLNSKNKKRVLKNVNESLKFLNHLLRVKSLYMTVNNHDDILSILPYIDPKTLKEIHIYEPSGNDNIVLNLDEIGQLEQWKQAKELEVRGFQLPHLAQNCQHFSKITLSLREISTEKLVLLKEMFLCSSTLTSMELHYHGNLSEDVIRQKLIESYGQHFVDNFQDRYWFFKIPDINQFLRIKFRYCFIHFNRIEQSDVPQNAKILN